MKGRIYQTIYRFSRHILFGWTLNRWAVVTLLFGPLILVLTPLQKTSWGWPLLILLFLLGLSGIFAIWRVRRGGFLSFEAETLAAEIPSNPLSLPAKIPIRASGSFSVNNVTRYFVEEPAYYQTFNTRERVIMVEIVHTRYLLLAQSSAVEIGWWYTFFTPDGIQSYESGQLCFGPRKRLALRLTYLPTETNTPQTIYFSFDNVEDCSRVLADLKTDADERQAT